ncbi:metallophosphoesterase [Falsiroseomonas sp. E2-1-a4]|uniref:metallophosphoesterase n=1 Tax=Falsiroseomonas sp. E2-1-a4 TaxID=3239299 RepID=UPI003F359F69
MATRQLIGATSTAFSLAPAPGSLPAGKRIYAIGDTHGCFARLADLHGMIIADLAARPIAQPLLLHLGDYVDRGPDSAGVLARLAQPIPGLPMVNLMGNHDRMMLDALAQGAATEAVSLWLLNGAGPTLESYGASPRKPESWARIPTVHLQLLHACRTSFAAGGYLFVHAGIRPDRALDRQDDADLLWIREPFLSWRGALPAVVVHGHTPAPGPEIRPHRVGLDTGAVMGGDLTCGVFETNQIGFLRA